MQTPRSTHEKALALNLDPSTYGTFAEIGGGQEVARWFFSVGGAATGVAKAISAYDMAVSDGLYGPAPRYVSRQRLEAMLEHELAQLLQQLGPRRGDTTTFFAFADTVATQSYGHADSGRGWLGVRFQERPHDAASDIVLHAHLLDASALHQKETLGILGVNLLYGAFYQRETPEGLIASLLDDLPRARVEVDMIRFTGPAFARVDNRLAALELVRRGLTDAAMIRANGEIVQPSDVLHKKPILIERGSFRPATKLTVDLLERARAQFAEQLHGEEPVVLAEMTLRSLSDGPGLEPVDFLDRADILGALGLDVLVSRFEPYYQVAEYLSRYTDRPIGVAVGLPSIQQIADERYYGDLAGGVLESAGRLFKRSVKMYVYPTRDGASPKPQTLEETVLPRPWQHLRDLLIETGGLEPIRHYDESLLSIHTPDVRRRIETGDASWETMVPPTVAKMIKEKKLFGYAAASDHRVTLRRPETSSSPAPS
jgi:hypothetical protein